MKAWIGLLMLVPAWMTGCNSGNKDTGGNVDPDNHGRASLTIASPAEGETFAEGDTVEFEVSASYDDGTDADISAATWTVGDWTTDGASASTADLAAGSWEVGVEATVDGHDLSGAVNIVVEAGGSEGGGSEGGGSEGGGSGGGEAVNFAGPIAAQVMLTTGGSTYPFDCPGDITFTIDAGGVVTGFGQCSLEGLDTDITFDVTGTDDHGTVSGALAITADDGSTYETPYTGARTTEDHVHAAYDSTFSSSDGSVRIVGTFDGDPI